MLAVDAVAPDASAAELTEADRALLAPRLRALAALLADSDMAALDAVTALRRDLGGHGHAPLQALADAVQGLDFERAQGLCAALLTGESA
jgi:hypothetical protein